MHDLISDQLTASAVIVFALQALKKSPWFPWINAQTPRLNRLVAVLASGATAIGISWQYDPAAHTLIIGNLCLACVLGGAWHWLRSFAVQEILYRVAANSPAQSGSNGTPAPPTQPLMGTMKQPGT